MRITWLIIVGYSTLTLSNKSQRSNSKHYNYFQFSPESWAKISNYTCEELKRWLGSEKHYANNLKTFFFSLLNDNSDCSSSPTLNFENIKYENARRPTSFSQYKSKTESCATHDKAAVIFLSNFSINNNYAHFLHALLRLFCSLIDAKWIRWNSSENSFTKFTPFTIWIDPAVKLDEKKLQWFQLLHVNIRPLGMIPVGECVTASTLVYGSGCAGLLPPEKWFGYPGCRASRMLPLLGEYLRLQSQTPAPLVINNHQLDDLSGAIRIVFGVRTVGALTGQRTIGNLETIQTSLTKSLKLKHLVTNITFETLNASLTVRSMASTHIFISVHGAGMTNTFFMRPGSVVIEIMPWPLCTCRSNDYFYGMAGFYHGSSLAIGLRHHVYCVTQDQQVNNDKPTRNAAAGGGGTSVSSAGVGGRNGTGASGTGKCSWKHLHAVRSVTLDPVQFNGIVRVSERELVAGGLVTLSRPIVSLNPHVNGR